MPSKQPRNRKSGKMDKQAWTPAPLSVLLYPTLTSICILCSDLRNIQWWETQRRFNPRTPSISEVRHSLNNVTWKMGLCSLWGNAQRPPFVKGSRNPFNLGLFLLSSSQGTSLVKIHCLLPIPPEVQRGGSPPPNLANILADSCSPTGLWYGTV